MRAAISRVRLMRVLQCRKTESIPYWECNGLCGIRRAHELKIHKIRCERPLHFGHDHR